MPSLRRLVSAKPIGIFAVLWPVVFLAPLVPGLPKAWTSFPWRQELAISVLLAVTLGLLIKRIQFARTTQLSFQRSELAIYLPLALFITWSIASLLWTGAWLHTLHYNLSWCSYFLCFVLMRQAAKSPKMLTASLGSLAFVLVIISIASAVEFWATSPELYIYSLVLRRSTGLGEPLAVAVPIFAILAISLKNRRAAILCGVTTVLAWLAVLQSLERAPLVGLAVGFVLMLTGIVLKKSWRPRQPRQAFVLIAVLVATTVFQTVVPGVSSSIHRFQELEGSNTQIRLLVWAISLEMLREHPVRGVGANNYEIAYPSARAEYSARQPNSPLVPLQDEFLAQRTHNEYLQILAELGAIGFAIFLIFCAALIWLAIRALRSARNPLALGAVCSLATFAISSGASSISFRWFGSGLLFFFAAALVVHFAMSGAKETTSTNVSLAMARVATAGGLAIATTFTFLMTLQGMNSVLRGMALGGGMTLTGHSANSTSEGTERLFRAALRTNPYDGATHFDFGGWLDGKKRYSEAAQHLRFATEHGFNGSTCFAYLARAEAAAGDTVAAERTLAKAVRIYPRSVFLRVRHAIALAEIGQSAEAAKEYKQALETNRAAARGWRHLMVFGADAAYAAANADRDISPPKNLEPQSWAYPASAEQALRPPSAYPLDDESNRTF